MSIEKARKILGDIGEQLSDKQIEELLALYRAISRVFIERHQQKKLKKS